MLFKEFGNKNAPSFVSLHGGGLSWWSLQGIIDILKEDYHVIVPIIDGHGEDNSTTFITIQDSAQKLITYIDQNLRGKAFVLSGLSIGAQIVTEVLSKRPGISEYAIIESALVFPIKAIPLLATPIYSLFYGLIQARWFAKIQAKSLNIPNEMFESYYSDSSKMSKQSLINIALSNSQYTLSKSLSATTANVLILVGDKEQKVMIKSAHELHKAIKKSQLQVLAHMAHGEMSLCYPDQYVGMIMQFIADII